MEEKGGSKVGERGKVVKDKELEEKGWETGNSVTFSRWGGTSNDKQKFLQDYHSHLLKVIGHMESFFSDPVEVAQVRYGNDSSVERLTAKDPDKCGSVFKLGTVARAGGGTRCSPSSK